jgi:hypothetical protein
LHVHDHFFRSSRHVSVVETRVSPVEIRSGRVAAVHRF